MPSSSPDLLPLAQRHHRAGRLDDAERFYLQVLRHSPQHPQTLHYLGLLRHQKGNTADALKLMRQSIALLPNAPEFHNNLAAALAGLAPSAEPRTLPPLSIRIGPGELLDRLTIMELKARHITDPARRTGLLAELESLAHLKAALPASSQLDALAADLLAVNRDLWQTEDDLRLLDRQHDFGERFIALAQSVYRTNDRRSDLKRQIDELLGSAITEQKLYAKPTPSAFSA